MVDTPAIAAQMGEVAGDTRLALLLHDAPGEGIGDPGTIPGAGADLAADPVQPPSRDLRITPFRGTGQQIQRLLGPPGEASDLPGLLVGFTDRPAGVSSRFLGMPLDGPEGITNEGVQVIDGFAVVSSVAGVRPIQKHSEAT